MQRSDWPLRLFKALLRAYPRHFRQEYRPDLIQAFRDRRSEARFQGPLGALRLGRLVVADLARCWFSHWQDQRFGRSPFQPLPKTIGRENLMESLKNDLRYALRSFARNKAFFLVALATLALGVGANSAIFSVVDGVLWRPFPYPEPERIVRIYDTNLSKGYTQFGSSVQNYRDWKDQNRAFASMAAVRFGSANLTGGDEPARVRLSRTSADLFSMLGRQPLLGRLFDCDEFSAQQSLLAVLSYPFWQSHFGADPNVIGRDIQLDSRPYQIVAVMPEGFYFPAPGWDLWVPIDLGIVLKQGYSRGAHVMSVLARLAPGVTLEQAQTEMKAIAGRLEQEYPEDNQGWSVKLVPFHQVMVGTARQSLLVLWVAVSLVTLIACLNVANLILARTTARQRELALRGALGASWRRLLRQLLTETLLLSLLGGLLGLLLARLAMQFWMQDIIANLPRNQQISMDGRVVLFTLGLSLLTALFSGLLPTWSASRKDLIRTLREGGRTTVLSGRRWLRQGLVVSEVALALMLLISAGLMMGSLSRLTLVDPGFNPDRVLSLAVSLPFSRYANPADRIGFYESLIERLNAMPQVESSAASDILPLQGGSVWGFRVEGTLEGNPRSDWPSSQYRVVTPGYFESMQIPLLKGRGLSGRDRQDAPFTCLVNQAFAEQFFPDSHPIGQRLLISNRESWVEIVGLVSDVRVTSLDSQAVPVIYAPHAQNAFGTMRMVLRTRSESLQMTPAIRAQLQSLDAGLPLYAVQSLHQIVAQSIAGRQVPALLLSVFAAAALALTLVGIYGVMSYTVRQRNHDFGVMRALGARDRDVLGVTLRQGLRLTGLGILLGLAGAAVGTRLLTSLLYGVKAVDAPLYLALALLLGAIALLACYLPARRACRADPMQVLRSE